MFEQQTFFDSSIVIKTNLRSVLQASIFQQGLSGNRILLYAIVFEFCLSILLVYTPPLQTVFGTIDMEGVDWVLGLPFALFIFLYDESRKWIMRRYPDGFVKRWTYY